MIDCHWSLQKIAVQALQTFSKFTSKQRYPEELAALQRLLNEVSSNELNFDPELVADTSTYKVDNGTGNAPVTYVHLWEDSVFTMGVFVLKGGVTLPLHDHPSMTGLVKVIHGTATVRSFTERKDFKVPEEVLKELRPWQRRGVKVVDPLPVKELNTESDACILTPTESNFHEINAGSGPTAFLDILAPPYDHFSGQRECHYYKVFEELGEEKASPRYLVEIPQPREFWCSQSEYLGPEIDPYADLP